MTPVCIRCNQPIPKGSQAQPVMTPSGMRAQHPSNAEGTGCQVMPDHDPDGHLLWMFEQAEAHPFPAYRRFPKAAAP